MISSSMLSRSFHSLLVVGSMTGVFAACSHPTHHSSDSAQGLCSQRSIASIGGSCVAAFTRGPVETKALIEKFKVLRDERLKVLLPAISPEGSRGAVAVTLTDYNPEYHGWTWVRDGALVMREIGEARLREKDPKAKSHYNEMMEAYIDFSRRTQDRAGAKNLGEPRFNFKGEPYTGEWGRPQNDGPASRVLTLAPFLNDLLNRKQPGAKKLIELLYKKENPERVTSLLKRDLEYTAHHFREKTSDLWEEKTGHHFYTLMVQRAALLEGAAIARRLQDPKAAEFYEKTAGEISEWLESFWEKDKGFVGAARDVNPWRHPTASNLDLAVILGVIHTNRNQDSFGAMDPRIQATAFAAEATFAKLYSINNTLADSNGNRLEPAMGRYPEDVYNGHPDEAQRFTEGHPWVLTTFAMTEYYANVALAMMKTNSVQIDATNLMFFRALAPNEKVEIGTIEKSNPVYKALVEGAINKALGFGRRITFHLGDTISFPEQLHRATGKIISIPSLTWSDASALSALNRLELALEAVAKY